MRDLPSAVPRDKVRSIFSALLFYCNMLLTDFLHTGNMLYMKNELLKKHILLFNNLSLHVSVGKADAHLCL